MQTSLKRCGLKFSSRYNMPAKFPRGGSRTFFSSKSKMGTLANSEDPDEMRQNVAFHLGLHCLL